MGRSSSPKVLTFFALQALLVLGCGPVRSVACAENGEEEWLPLSMKVKSLFLQRKEKSYDAFLGWNLDIYISHWIRKWIKVICLCFQCSGLLKGNMGMLLCQVGTHYRGKYCVGTYYVCGLSWMVAVKEEEERFFESLTSSLPKMIHGATEQSFPR